MSINALSFAFRQRLPPLQKWLLVCLADYADDWGDSIFPALDTIEAKSGLSRKRLKRLLRSLIGRALLAQSAAATPVSPAFYRLVGVPEPHEAPRAKDATCPTPLRRAVIFAFERRCEACRRQGRGDVGPDSRPWQIVCLQADHPSGFVPENVSLLCQTCRGLVKRQPAVRLRSFFERQQEPLSAEGRGQFDPPSLGPLFEGGGVNLTPRGRGQNGPGGGVKTDRGEGPARPPDPSIDPSIDPSEERAGAPPRATHPPAETPDDPLPVITKIAHEVYDLLGLTADGIEVTEAVKGLCARRHIPYRRPPDIVRRAIESARWQREHRSTGS